MRSSHRIAEEWLKGAKGYHKPLLAGACVFVLLFPWSLLRADEQGAEGLSPPVNTLLPFSSDGCSWFPEGPIWAQSLWYHCCTAHDLAYWQGGDYIARLIADEQLRQCVTGQGEPIVAAAMLLGVRVGGSPFWPTPFRWGYGWQEARGYEPLTASEIVMVEQQLRKQNLLPAIKDDQ